MTELDKFFRLNGTLKIFEILNQIISNSETSFELILSDVIITGAVLAGRKHNIPVVTQHMGALMPTARNYPSRCQRAVEIAVENPEVSWTVYKYGISLFSVIAPTPPSTSICTSHL